MNINNYFSTYWLGKNSLSESIRYIWIIGGVFVSLIIMVVFLLYSLFIDDAPFSPDTLNFYISIGLSLYQLPASIIVWRCARNALKVYWKYISRLYICVSLIVIVIFYSKIISLFGANLNQIYKLSLY